MSKTTAGGSLSPDGSTLAFTQDRDLQGEHLVVANADGSSQRVLVRPTEDHDFIDCADAPTWSPDGKSLACWNHATVQGQAYVQLYSINATDGEMRLLTNKKWTNITGSVFMPDGSLVIAGGEVGPEMAAPNQLWRIPTSGEPNRITNDVTGYWRLSATRNGDVMITLQSRTVGDIWSAQGTDLTKAKTLTSSGEFNQGFNWTPDGRLLFGSTVTGNIDLWMMNTDGTHRIQLTSNQGANSEPSMTSDGKYIVFLNRTGYWANHLMRMDNDGKNIKSLVNDEMAQNYPRLSPDGKWLYYVQISKDGSTIRKVSINGGLSIMVAAVPYEAGTTSSVILKEISRNGGKIMIEYTRVDQVNAARHIAIIPSDIRSEGTGQAWPASVVTFDLPSTANGNVGWTPDGKHVAYRDSKGGICILDANGKGKPKTLIQFPSDARGYHWSYDGKQFGFIKIARTTDALSITNKGN